MRPTGYRELARARHLDAGMADASGVHMDMWWRVVVEVELDNCANPVVVRAQMLSLV
jgi:hypothetical protein